MIQKLGFVIVLLLFGFCIGLVLGPSKVEYIERPPVETIKYITIKEPPQVKVIVKTKVKKVVVEKLVTQTEVIHEACHIVRVEKDLNEYGVYGVLGTRSGLGFRSKLDYNWSFGIQGLNKGVIATTLGYDF